MRFKVEIVGPTYSHRNIRPTLKKLSAFCRGNTLVLDVRYKLHAKTKDICRCLCMPAYKVDPDEYCPETTYQIEAMHWSIDFFMYETVRYGFSPYYCFVARIRNTVWSEDTI